ncbi:trans-aconitate 2-methyltransferase [Methylophilus sp. OH31]|uniref:class I SAM-dependent methyltransferase n=1 Tax=Methylophilus sp. OH31 TaxID=1387312 RepID=UPI000466ACCC|nr:class I SAM-dependent methyltransferase [Methylophilus sp. OH31]
MVAEIPSPIDLKQTADAEEWARTALIKRPARTEFIAAFADIARQHASQKSIRILELGSGPGFLAENLLRTFPQCQYIALDFSPAMHTLARQRLGVSLDPTKKPIQFLERDFLDPNWVQGLGQFDLIVTMQAVHELRHKSRTSTLHTQVRGLLNSHGHYLVCDHHTDTGGMHNTELYMSILEQQSSLAEAGFNHIELILEKAGMALHRAHCH